MTKKSRGLAVTTSSMSRSLSFAHHIDNVIKKIRCEIEAVSATVGWLVDQEVSHAVVLADSMGMQRKIEKNCLRRE